MFIEKTYRVEYAHRLAGHDGPCRFLHGHCGVVIVQLEGPIDVKTGMIIDFGALGWLKDIVMKFDHATALDKEDPLYKLLNKSQNVGELPHLNIIPMDGPPTAENFCSYLEEKIKWSLTFYKERFKSIFLKSISFQETLGNRAVQEY